MSKPINQAITDYIKSQSRNKIIFYSQDISALQSVNVGRRLSESIYNLNEPGRIAMRVLSELDGILNAAISQHDVFGRYLSIENIGVLFEPELKLDFASLLDSYSQNNVLFVKWEGEIDAENIYFLTKEKGIKKNIKNLSHIVI
ncbi:MAG: hypothetical protein EBX50_12390 [Chitinophagia bacterium]|nr:hypothetical protein [Chitinophagia bacterium]